MKFTLLPAVVPWGGADACQYLSSCLVNGSVALDAGTVGFVGTPEQQAAISHVFLTHAHLDHIASLPMFLENVYDLRSSPPTIYGSADVIDALQRDVFNDRLWPDFIALSKQMRPFLRLVPFEAGQTVTVEGLRVTAVAVDHVVPTVGYLLSDASGTVAFIPDTGPTREIWAQAAACDDLRAIVIETTFPNELSWLADVSRHLTPALLCEELSRLGRTVPVYVMHLKARYRVAVREQLASCNLPNLTILEPGQVYSL